MQPERRGKARMTQSIVSQSTDGAEVSLHSPVRMPHASGFLWNEQMLARFNVRGFAHAQFMQPEPASYSTGPVLEATTFLQPELGFYAHHPGRFVYIVDTESEHCFSIPYEPMRRQSDAFCFTVTDDRVRWRIAHDDLTIDWSVTLASDAVAEIWSLTVTNASARPRHLRIYPVFSIGYMSWLNQSASFDADHHCIIAQSVPPYQKLEEYPRIAAMRACTFLAADRAPVSYETIQSEFEGEGGLANPDAISRNELQRGTAAYEVPIAAMQFNESVAAGDTYKLRLLFGPAHDPAEIASLRARWLTTETATVTLPSALRVTAAVGDLSTPDAALDGFVNHWLPRQVDYHGALHRLTTDPQTRNYLQDALGQVYLRPERARHAIMTALSQQHTDGSMPDGVLLHAGASLKYINQVPHTDHAVWLPLLVAAYLDETGDHTVLDAEITASDNTTRSVRERVLAAVEALLRNLDDRHLSLIAQGDWCDPMNMVGHQGRGVSGWLSMATIVAVNRWADVCQQIGDTDIGERLRTRSARIALSVQQHLWTGEWYARGITDDGRRFGVPEEQEGRIYLNAQSWALLADLPDKDQQNALLSAIDEHLLTPFGPMLLAPPYTRMVEDIGRLTQKHPGYAENGSIYNHAVMFLVHALYRCRDAERAYSLLQRSLPGPEQDDLLQRGQLPTFMPNYYRGAVHEFPRTAGRSSQLINTGAASWYLRIVVEQLFGLRGTPEGLVVDPQLPMAWQTAELTRQFRGATISVHYRREGQALKVLCDGEHVPDHTLRRIVAGARYAVEVRVPELL